MYYCSDVDIYHLYGTLLVLAHTFISSRETRQCMYVGSIPYAGSIASRLKLTRGSLHLSGSSNLPCNLASKRTFSSFLSLDQVNERYVKNIIPLSQKGEEEEKHSITSNFFSSDQKSPNQQ